VLWKTVLVTVGLADCLVLAGIVTVTFGGARRAALLAGAAGGLAVHLALIARSDDTGHAVWNGALTIVAVLAVAFAGAVHEARRLGWILLGLGLSAAGLAAQRTGVAAGILNHNDICHVLQTAALWPFYYAGRRLRGRGRGRVGQRPSFSRKTALSSPARSLW
jgi:hypothetical protein